MKKQKKHFFKYGITAIIFCAVFVTAISIKAAVNDATGWLWGGSESSSDGNINNGLSGNETGLGWVSLNSTNPGAGGGSTYAINIPKTNGAVTGYAWSGGTDANNLGMGWIDFESQNHCTTGTPSATQYRAASCTVPSGYPTLGTGGIFRSGNALIGWARFVNIAQATVAPSNAGGWDGWIGIGVGNGYDVSIATDGGMSGYGWSELGAVNFLGQGAVDINVTLSSSSSPIFLADGENRSSKTATLTWGVVTGGTLTCTKSCVEHVGGAVRACTNWSGTFAGNPAPGSSGTISNVSLPSNNIDFIFQCVDENGIPSNKATVNFQTGCANKACSAQKCALDISNWIQTDLGSSCPDTSNACTVSGDCEARSVGDWKEVAP